MIWELGCRPKEKVWHAHCYCCFFEGVYCLSFSYCLGFSDEIWAFGVGLLIVSFAMYFYPPVWRLEVWPPELLGNGLGHEPSEGTTLPGPHQVWPVVAGQLKRAPRVRRWVLVIGERLPVCVRAVAICWRRLCGRVESHKWSGSTDCHIWFELGLARHVVVWWLPPEGRGYGWCLGGQTGLSWLLLVWPACGSLVRWSRLLG